MEKTEERRGRAVGGAKEGEAAASPRAERKARKSPLALLREAYARRENKGRELALDLAFGAMACFLAQTHGLFGAYPFALGLLAATPRRVLPCFLGAALGCYFMGGVGVLYLFVYAAVPLFRLLLSYPFSWRKAPPTALFSEEPALRILIAASAALGMAIYEFVVAGVVTYTLLFALGVVLLSSLACFFYVGALDYGVTLSFLLGKEEKGDGAHSAKPFFCVSALVLVYTVALSLMKTELFGISLGTLFGFALTLLVSRRYGALFGCAVGLAVGLAGALLYVPSFCLFGLLSGLLWRAGIPLALSAAAASAGGYAVYAGGLSGFLAVVPEVAVGALLLWPLLSRLPTEEERAREALLPISEAKDGSLRGGEAATERLSTALYNLSGIKGGIEEEGGEEGYFLLAARAADKHCRACKSKSGCAERRKSEALLSALAEEIRRGEPFSAKNQEKIKALSQRCGEFSEMLRELETGAALLEERRSRHPLYSLLLSDYALFSRMLNELSTTAEEERRENEGESRALLEALNERGYQAKGVSVYGKRQKKIKIAHVDKGGRAVSAQALRALCEEVLGLAFTLPRLIREEKGKPVFLKARPRFSVSVAYAAAAKGEDEPSGDALRSFENAEGYHYSLLCDGMGTGREAAHAAEESAYFLSELLRAGNRMASSLRLLNNFVRARGEEGTVTVDLCELDLLLGAATFLKSGAAPSFLKRKTSLFRIRSRTVPLGLFGTPDSERVNVEIEAGDRIILLSDGILLREESEALRAALLLEGVSPKAQAEAILAAAEAKDDRSVAVLEISSFAEGEGDASADASAAT